MKAMNYRGPRRVRIEEKPMPTIQHPNDAIVKVLRTCICGSDLHLYHGMVPDTRVGSTFGHEFIGLVEAVGSSVEKIKVGDTVLVSFILPAANVYFAGKVCLVPATKPILWLLLLVEFTDTPTLPVATMAV